MRRFNQLLARSPQPLYNPPGSLAFLPKEPRHAPRPYIRGEQDWISSIEGGTVYHTDTWGTRNTVTGEFYGDQPYDYVNFTGQNPRYPSEQMTPIDSRQLWEQAIRRQ